MKLEVGVLVVMRRTVTETAIAKAIRATGAGNMEGRGECHDIGSGVWEICTRTDLIKLGDCP